MFKFEAKIERNSPLLRSTAGMQEVEQRMEQLPTTARMQEVEQRMEQLPRFGTKKLDILDSRFSFIT